ncbi:unnamed protein product [Dovyalis caffra]|uniref:Uncharacterized protein n=1 Tax=Dovyalis caffra TaxID=77055 RepID=A0AAV1SGL4_9ROSI|nr:unnamed protein product [Dovyalis caffra]
MADCVAVSSPSFANLHLRRSCVKARASQTKYSYGNFKVIQLSTRKTCDSGLSNLKASPVIRRTSLKRRCFGSLVDPNGAVPSAWISVSDQLLLMASIFLTYMAGVIPLRNSDFTTRKNFLEDNVVVETPTSSGSYRKKDDHVNLKHAWDAVKKKLLDSLDSMERKSNMGNKVLQFEQQHTKRPLSLFAVSEGPKLRLLWASLQRLEEEAGTVNKVFADCDAVSMDDWLTIFPEIIQKSCHPVCMAWLVEELHLENKKSDMALVSLMFEKLKGDDIVLQNIRKSGKEDLYAELLYFLRFGSLRKSCCYDCRLFVLHGDSILEDLVITLADGIASVYLELISVDGNLSNEMNSLDMFMCNLSTRALQRLRNEVALNQWMYQNVEAVVSMYEDRFDLCTLQLKVSEEPSENQIENHTWWKKLTLRKSGMVRSSCFSAISHFSMSVKRTKELRALTGWRYYFSLYLELSDIMMPLVRAVIDKVSNAISFFLVTLIGRSLGLICTGIRQSLRWK